MSKNNEYTAKAYEDLLLLIKESDVFDQIFGSSENCVGGYFYTKVSR